MRIWPHTKLNHETKKKSNNLHWVLKKDTMAEMKLSEHDIQKQIVDYLRLRRVLIVETDVMSGLQFFSHKDRRRFGFINHHKRMGYMSGSPDLVLVLPGKVFFVEIKTEKGFQSETQKVFQKELESRNQEYLIWRSANDAICWWEAHNNKLA